MRVLLTICGLACCLGAWAAGTALLSGGKDFAPLTDGWKVSADAVTGESPTYYSLPQTARGDFGDDSWTYFTVHPVNLWRYAVAGNPEWTDYTFACTVQLEKPAPLVGPRIGETFFNYQWGREAVGSDAGIIVRYQGPDDYYMVRLSSGYGHVELWKTHGGVVQVKPFAFDAKKAYKVAVTAAGRWISIAIDGKEIMKYADPQAPLRAGKVGVGVRESRVRFSDLQVASAASNTDPAPAHKADFHLRKWVGRDYIFDGDEPVGYFLALPSSGLELRECKLQPGLMPMLIPFVGMASYDYKTGGDYKITRDGKQFAFTATVRHKDDGFICHADWTLDYDPARGYVWDKKVMLDVLKDKALNDWPELDDPYYYQLVAPATDKLPKCRQVPNYSIKDGLDGHIIAFPAAHHLWTDGLGDQSKAIIKPGGSIITTVDGWGVVSEIPTDNSYQFITAYCHWGLDQHVHNWPAHHPAVGEKFTGHIRYSLLEPAAVTAKYMRGVLPAPNRENPAQLVRHVEPVNHMQDIYPGLTGESVRLWTGNYTVDRTVGHGDSISMRIDAATISKRLNGAYGDERPNVWLGPSYWTGPYLASRYRFGMWVKADNFTGKVVLLANNFNPPNGKKMPDVSAELPINGKCDWTYVTFDADFPRNMYNWVLRIDPVGTGVVWVDDIEVTPKEK